MRTDAVYHRTSDHYCYALSNDELIINLKTGYDIRRVFLIYGDPYSQGIWGANQSWKGEEIEIYYKKRLKEGIWWTTTVKPRYKRCRYYFRLVSDDETLFFFENGFFSEEEITRFGNSLQYFTFPWMNPADLNQTPHWVNDTVWYQIFPDRFCNGDPKNDPPGVKPWECRPVGPFESFGGDLEGILQKLDYLAGLGVTGLYLTPIFKAESNHKYDTTDYFEIDPSFGTKETLHRLVETAHQKGMRVMLDGVFNHCGPKFAPWLDAVKNGPKSRYFHWFMINRWPFDPDHGDTSDARYYSFAFAANMPKLNTNDPEVQQYILDVVRYWITEFDIDGFRLDVANELSHALCKKMRTLVKSLKSDFYLLGEVWHDAIAWLRGDEFDAVMNYPLTFGINEFWRSLRQNSSALEFDINHYYTMYMQQTNDVLFNLLDSHDTDRIFTRAGNPDIAYQQLALLFTMPGSPCIFYGTEIGMEGSFDPDCRRCMPWADIGAGKYDERIRDMKELIRLRKTEPTFKSRNFHFPNEYGDRRVVQYIKIDWDRKIEILLNCDEKPVSIPSGGKVYFSRLYHDGILERNGTLIREYR